MVKSRFSSSIAIIAALATFAPKSMANCNPDYLVPNGLDDLAHTRWMHMSDANRQDFLTVFRQDYVWWGVWDGWNQPTEGATVFGKWLGAAWIVNFGINDDNMPTGGCVPGFCVNFNDRPWHGRRDYRRLGKSCHTTAHHEFDAYYTSDIGADGALAEYRTFQSWPDDASESEVLYCQLFDVTQFPGTANPVVRAGSLVHEGQHAWQFRYHEDVWHDGKCGGYDCDDWNYHRRYDIPENELVHSEHRPYQVGWEFLCDIAEHYNDSLPLDLVIAADSWAENRAGRARNGPVPHCGNPAPAHTPRASNAACVWTACNSVDDCNYYGLYTTPICNNGCCKETASGPPLY
jgi:hypothetical protein